MQETLRRMSEDRSLTHPDLLTLSCPRISHLRVTLAGQEPSATPAPGTATTAKGQSATTAQSGSGGAGVSLLSLLTVVRRNRHLTALTLKGMRNADVFSFHYTANAFNHITLQYGALTL